MQTWHNFIKVLSQTFNSRGLLGHKISKDLAQKENVQLNWMFPLTQEVENCPNHMGPKMLKIYRTW
jgi:hypothetical protein